MINYVQILILNYPGAEWVLTGADYSGLNWIDNTPKPTQQELDALWPSTQEELAKQDCKKKAQEFLYATDWTTIADVADPTKSNPYLVNQDEFTVYRSTVRGYAVNPVVDPVWPTIPTEQWSS